MSKTRSTKCRLEREIMYLPRPSSKYKGSYPKYFEKHIKRLLETENYIHLFSGSAQTGLRVDINFNSKPDVVADCHNLPFKDNSFNGGFADPPYNAKFSDKLYDTQQVHFYKWTKELSRVVKPSCKIGIMHVVVLPKIFNCKYIKIVAILLRIWQITKIVIIYQKKENLEEFLK